MNVSASVMMAETLLPEARCWIRRSSVSDLDTEVKQTVAACFLDMSGAGVVNFDPADPLLQQAAKLYLKAHFGFNAESAKYEAAYEHLKISMSLCSDYNRLPEVTDGG